MPLLCQKWHNLCAPPPPFSTSSIIPILVPLLHHAVIPKYVPVSQNIQHSGTFLFMSINKNILVSMNLYLLFYDATIWGKLEVFFSYSCTSFAIRQQQLPPGVTNCMVFNFNCCRDQKELVILIMPAPPPLPLVL